MDTGDDVAPHSMRTMSPGMVLNMRLGGSVIGSSWSGAEPARSKRHQACPIRRGGVDEAVDNVVDIIVELYAEQAGGSKRRQFP